jgi:protein phosphatase
LQDVNQSLCDEAVRRREQIMGSTVVVLLAFDRHCVSMWAGDSRAYIYRDGELRQLTRDHSQVEDLVSQGLLTRQQAAHHPASNIITRAVGVSQHLDIDTEMFEVKEGDIFLLCTDGLYNEVNADEITQSLASGSSQQACELLLERALARGARDNVTVVVVRAEDASQITQLGSTGRRDCEGRAPRSREAS